jgi:hypothetical protein
MPIAKLRKALNRRKGKKNPTDARLKADASRPLTAEEKAIARKRYIKAKLMKPHSKIGEGVRLYAIHEDKTAWHDAKLERISVVNQEPGSTKLKVDVVFKIGEKEYSYPKEIEINQRATGFDGIPIGIHFKEENGKEKQFLVVKFDEGRTMAYEIETKLPIMPYRK